MMKTVYWFAGVVCLLGVAGGFAHGKDAEIIQAAAIDMIVTGDPGNGQPLAGPSLHELCNQNCQTERLNKWRERLAG